MKKGKLVIIFLTIISVLFVSGIAFLRTNWLQEKLRTTILHIARTELGIDAKIGSLDFSLVPLSISLTNTSLEKTGSFKLNLPSVLLFPKMFQPLPGKFVLKTVVVKNPELELFLEEAPAETTKDKADKKSGSEEKTTNSAMVAAAAGYLSPDLPAALRKLYIISGSIDLKIGENRVRIPALDAHISRKDSDDLWVSLTMEKPSLTVGKEEPLLLDLFSLKGLVNQKRLLLTSATLRNSGVNLALSGEIDNILASMPDYRLLLNIEGELPHLYSTARATLLTAEKLTGRKITSLPKLKLGGQIKSRSEITSGKSSPRIVGTVDLLDASINQFNLRKIAIDGIYENGKISVSRLQRNDAKTSFTLSDLQLKPSGRFPFSARVTFKDQSLKRFLADIDIPENPVDLNINGELKLSGSLAPVPVFDTSGYLDMYNCSVWLPYGRRDLPESTRAAGFKHARASGSMKLDFPNFRMREGIIESGDSTTKVDFDINYHKGFTLSFDSKKLNLASLGRITSLDFKGTGDLKGTIEGDGRSAVTLGSFKFNQSSVSNIILGDITGDISYRKNILSVSNASGLLISSKYTLRGAIDLSRDEVINSELKFLYGRVADVREAIRYYWVLPTFANGIVSGSITSHGPLVLRDINADFSIKLSSGRLFFEPYINGDMNFSKRALNWKLDSLNMYFNHGMTLSATGNVDYPKAAFDISTSNLSFEHLDIIKKSGYPYTGPIRINTKIGGTVERPKYDTSALFSLTSGDNNMGDCIASYLSHEPALKVSFSCFKKAVMANFETKGKKHNRYSSFLRFSGFDFGDLFEFNDKRTRTEAELDASLELSGDIDRPAKASGRLAVNSLKYSDGSLFFSMPKAFSVAVKAGQLTLPRLSLKGTDSSIKLSGGKDRRDNLDFITNGQINLAFLGRFLPFVVESRGILGFSAKLTGSVKKPELLGSAFLKDASFKLRDIAENLESTNAEISFSQNRILIDRWKSVFAGGSLDLGGQITTEGFTSLELDNTLKLTKSELNIIEGIDTTLDADLTITGRERPYSVNGTAVIRKLLYTVPVDASQAKGYSPPTKYLPQAVKIETDKAPWKLNIKLLADGTVEMKNNLLHAWASLNASLVGTPGNYGLIGSGTAPKGKIYFSDNIFNIDNAQATFPSPGTLSPRFSVSASSLVREYNINLSINNQNDNIGITLSSQPYLNERNLVSLLTLGITDVDLARDNEQFEESRERLGAAFLGVNLLDKDIRQSTGVKVSVSPDYSVNQRANVSKIKLERPLFTEDLRATYSKSLDQSAEQDIAVEYKINKNMSVMGIMESTEHTNVENPTSDSENSVGADLKFRFEFK